MIDSHAGINIEETHHCFINTLSGTDCDVPPSVNETVAHTHTHTRRGFSVETQYSSISSKLSVITFYAFG